jgi:PRKCA-binding protein
MISDLNTYLEKAIPDTKLTIQKYADCKFEYLSYCLKVKEMDDEEFSYAALQEQLYRVETGNYEYRLILRCRQLARIAFAKMRQDVLVKLELLDQKHVQDIIFQLHRFITAMSKYNTDCFETMKSITDIFPIEVDLPETTLFNPNDQENDKMAFKHEYNDNNEQEEEEEETDSADDFDEDDTDSSPNHQKNSNNNNTNDNNVANLLGID